MGARRVVVGIKIHADPSIAPTAATNEFGEFVKRVLRGVVHKGSELMMFCGQVRCDVRRLGVLFAPKPNRPGFLLMNDNRLWGVERPAIKTYQPGHVGGLADKYVKARVSHALSHVGHTPFNSFCRTLSEIPCGALPKGLSYRLPKPRSLSKIAIVRFIAAPSM